MAVHLKDNQTPLNGSQFYRANPYAELGFIPGYSLKNRKQPEFTTEIPQGIDYFEPSARRHYTDMIKKSEIAELNVLSTPEKFPFENQLASDLRYDRSLNTVDIVGASVNSKKSMGVKNRIKGQEELLRRKAKIITPLLATGPSEEDICRGMA